MNATEQSGCDSWPPQSCSPSRFISLLQPGMAAGGLRQSPPIPPAQG